MDAAAPDEPSDGELVGRCGRDPAAFRSLYDRYARRVFGLLATLRLDPHAADDVAQQVWLKAWRGLAGKPAGSPFAAWLFQIARNAAVDHRRKRKPVPLADGAGLPAGGPRDALADAVETDELTRLRACLAELPDLERRVMGDRLEGLGSPAIAAAVGLPDERVHRIFHDAKRKLRRCLGVT